MGGRVGQEADWKAEEWGNGQVKRDGYRPGYAFSKKEESRH